MNRLVAGDGSRVVAVNERPHKQIHRVISLGGCATYETARLASKDSIIHADHLWRRPTIALVAPRTKFNPIPSVFPVEFARYWHDDFNKSHLDNLLEHKANVLIFDVVRDIWTGIIRKNQTYVMDPVDGMHFVGQLPWGALSDEANAQLRAGDQVYNYKHEDFFDLWKEHVDIFIAIAGNKFEHIFLNKHYFATHRVRSGKRAIEGIFGNVDSDDFAQVNNILEDMYAYLSGFSVLKINTISRSLMLTGRHVPMVGPFPTHFVHESNALFAENFRSQLLRKSYIQGSKFIATALDRVKAHEDLLIEVDQLRELVAHVSRERDDACSQNRHLKSEVERLNAQPDLISVERNQFEAAHTQVVSERDAIRAEVERLSAERRHLEAIHAQTASERDTALAVKERLSAERGHIDALFAQTAGERDLANSEIAQLKAEQGHLEATIAQISSQLDLANSEIDQLKAKQGHLEATVAQVSSEREVARAEVERLEGTRVHLEAGLAQVSAERNAAQIELRQIVAERIIRNDRSWRSIFFKRAL